MDPDPHQTVISLQETCVADPHHFDADQDSTYHPDADPDANPDYDFLFDAYPGLAFHPDADPDPDLASKKGLKPLKKF